MKLKIPNPQQSLILKQVNNSSVLGDIVSSFNLDLTTDLGKIKNTKTLLSKKSTGYTVTDFGSTQSLGVGGFATLNNVITMISGERIWNGGNSPSDAVTIDAQAGTPTVSLQQGDIKNFNSKIYVSSSDNIYSSSGAGWSNVYTYGTAGTTHLLEVHKGKLYFVFENYKIGNLTTANSPTVSGAGSVDLALPGFVISFLKSDGDYLWIGLVNTTGGQQEKTYVMRWDGSNTDVNQKYLIESRAVMAGCLVDGVPYIVDCNGRLLGFNGAFFIEVDRFPLKSNEYLYSIGTTHERGIHPNGMIYDSINGEILINIANVQRFTANVPTFYNFPGGVWSYKKETGLLHKYSPSLQPIADSGITNLTEYGQYNVVLAGAIMLVGLRGTSTEKGRVLFGSVIYNQISADYTSNSIVVLCTDDTLNTAQKYGWFITSEIHSPTINEIWQSVTALYKRLLTSTDKISLKYRTRDDTPTQANVTWADMSILTTTTDVSAYSMGDEVQLIQGSGSGKSYHINSITNNGGTYTIELDDALQSSVIGLTAVALFSKWKKLGEVTYTDEQQYKTLMPMGQNVSPKIQLKVALQFTGDNEMNSLFISSESSVK